MVAAGAPAPHHLLEVTVISAQDLHRPRFRRVRAYAVAWAAGDNDGRRHRTGADLAGGADPRWTDGRFVFRVGAGFLRSDTAAVTVEVRAARAFGADRVLGVTRIVVSAFVRRGAGKPSSSWENHGRQVAALQLRRPRSLRPQGIINVAVALLDGANGMPHHHGSPSSYAVKERRPAVARSVERSWRRDSTRGAAVEQTELARKVDKWRANSLGRVRRPGAMVRAASSSSTSSSRAGAPSLEEARHGWNAWKTCLTRKPSFRRQRTI